MKKKVSLHFESKLINGFHLSNMKNDIDKPIIFLYESNKILNDDYAYSFYFREGNNYTIALPTRKHKGCAIRLVRDY